MFIKIENEEKFVKNITNNSLVNNNRADLIEYRNKKQLQSKVNDLSAEINTMKSDIADIKSLLLDLVNNKQTEK